MHDDAKTGAARLCPHAGPAAEGQTLDAAGVSLTQSVHADTEVVAGSVPEQRAADAVEVREPVVDGAEPIPSARATGPRYPSA